MKYNTLVIDPPWDIKMTGIPKVRSNRATELPYKTMSLEEIKKIDISQWANEGAHIYLWITNRLLKEGFEVLEAWNVRYYMTLTWIKPSGMLSELGYASTSEFCLLGFYGKKQPFLKSGQKNWIKENNQAGTHSTKPEIFYWLVETMSPGPRIDIFSRHRRLDWASWGNEV